jgi:hypothetical protein
MPTITLAKTPREKFAYFTLLYTNHSDHRVGHFELLNAFLEREDRDPDWKLEDIREVIRTLATIQAGTVREFIDAILEADCGE